MMVGMGIRLLKEMNLALLGKTLWRIEDDSQGLWKRVLFSKYEIPKDSLLVHDPSRSSSLWKRILAAKEMFMKQVRFRVGKGDKILFYL